MTTKLLTQITNPVLPKSIGSAGRQGGGTATGALISQVVALLFIVSFIMTFLYLLIGALNWITSEGDKAKLEKARNSITHAIVGLIIVGAAWAIATLVGDFFGLSFESLPIPTIK